jgi:hypothetical protein
LRSSRPDPQRKEQPKIYDLLFGTAEGKPKPMVEEEEKESWYIGYCKTAARYAGKGAKKELTEQYKVALAFLGWKLKPEELNSAPVFTAFWAFGLALAWAILNFFFREAPILGIIGRPITLDALGLAWYAVPFGLAFYAMYYVQVFPLKEVEKERIRSLTWIPEIINYLVMAMKVTPNLERAMAFAAEHGHGKIARDFKNLIYDLHIGKYRTVEEALDNIAWRWGEHSEEFKHALMMIRSSVMEADELRRAALLDKAVEDVLAGITEKMDVYSRAMHQPSIYLYYFGVLLPLLLIIVIPVGAMLGGQGIGFLASTPVLAFIYNLAIPVASLFLARSILGRRPPTRSVPVIPPDLPGLPKRGWFKIGKSQLPVLFVAIGIFLATVVAAVVLTPVATPRPKSFETGFKTYCVVGIDATPPEGKSIFQPVPGQEDFCVPFLQYAGIVWGLVAAVSFWLWAMNKDMRRVQLEIVDMENQFQDTLYVLASRLGEGRPFEDALRYAAEFLPKSPATKRIFLPTLQNITLLGMTVKNAMFDDAYGSLRYIPSGFIRGTMRIVVDSLALGVQMAARSIISLSVQLRDSQKVEKQLRGLLEDITQMMSTMSIFIAPVVLGITIALQQIIIGAMRSMSEAGISKQLSGTGTEAFGGLSAFRPPQLGNPEVLKQAAGQTELLVIITFYMIEIVIVLMYFASNVNEGKNRLAFNMAIAQALPISVALFLAVTFFAGKLTAIGI